MPLLQPEPVRQEELPLAVHLFFGRLPPGEREQRLVGFLRLVESGEIDPRGIFVLREAGGLCGVMVCAALPGAVALVWPPICTEGPLRERREDELVQHACAWLRGQGAQIAQGLLSWDEVELGSALARNGLPHVTNLWYLRHDLDLSLRWLELPVRLSFENYSDNQDDFHRTLFRTYEQTQDCPEVSGARSLERVIEGHKAQGRFDPRRWWLAREGGECVGVLMMLLAADSSEWELAYLGLVPEARGRGLGQELLLRGLCEARAAEAPAVTLSVDDRNGPARRLYRQFGFSPYEKRAVFLAVWR
jgi:ribosomal protein S18 acetylase RimI-like enzyme